MAKKSNEGGFFKNYFGKIFKLRLKELNWKEWILTAFIVLTIIGAFVPSDQTKKTEKPAQTTQKINNIDGKKYAELIKSAIKEGIIKKVVIESSEVYVDPIVWTYMNIDAKKGMSIVAANYIAYAADKSADMAHVDIKSYLDGKKLAYYGAWGFKVY